MTDQPLNWLRRILRPKLEPPALRTSGAFETIGPYYDELMSTVPYRGWVDYIEGILDRLGTRPRTVLDLACGTGKVGAEMVRRGYPRVFGIDLSEGMVRVAVEQQRLRAAVQDARALGLKPESFDLVVSLYDSLNYILEPDALFACFRSICECLRPGGVLIFDLNTIRALELDLFTQDNLRSRAPLLFSWKSSWDEKTRICTVRMWFRWRQQDEDYEFVEVHRQRGYTDEEVRERLGAAGLTVVSVHDGYTFEPVRGRSTRVFYVAQR